MTDNDPLVEADTADLAEQRQGVGGGADDTLPADPDAPAGGTAPRPADVGGTTPLDANEADALEQRTVVGDDDRDEGRGDDGGS